MKKIYIVTLFLGVLFLDMACEDSTVYSNDVALVNLSKDTISFGWTWATDTILTPKLAFIRTMYYVVPPKDSVIVRGASPINGLYYGVSQFMVFKKSTLDSYSESEIIEKNIYDTLYVYDHEQLKAMNFTIRYNGK